MLPIKLQGRRSSVHGVNIVGHLPQLTMNIMIDGSVRGGVGPTLIVHLCRNKKHLISIETKKLH